MLSERARGIALLIIVALALLGVILFQALRPQPPSIIFGTAAPDVSPVPTATPRPLRVYISGAVQKPDVYSLPAESIVKDALLAAGGAATDADLDRINLAQPLADGQQIHVPRRGETAVPVPVGAGSGQSAGGKVNINTADAPALESLPGIGPSLATRIVEYRQANGPFATIQSILDVPGIGEATFDKLRELITTN